MFNTFESYIKNVFDILIKSLTRNIVIGMKSIEYK